MHGMHSECDSVRGKQRYEVQAECYNNCVYSLPTDLDKETEKREEELIKGRKIQIVILVTSPGLFENVRKE